MSARPLEGRVVVITRRPEQSEELRRVLEDRGATVVELPAVEVGPPADLRPLDAALNRLDAFSWVAFTSANAVHAVAGRLRALGLAGEIGARGPRVAVVGRVTARALSEVFPGDRVALRPEDEENSVALAQAFVRRGVRGELILLPASTRGRPDLEEALRGAGASVERVAAYETRWPPGLASRLEECLRRGPDAFVFASPSAVQGLAGAGLAGRPAVVIGPTTEAAAREAGLVVLAVARSPSAAGLAEAVVRGLPSS